MLINFRVDDNDAKQFKELCSDVDTTMSAEFRKFIKQQLFYAKFGGEPYEWSRVPLRLPGNKRSREHDDAGTDGKDQ